MNYLNEVQLVKQIETLYHLQKTKKKYKDKQKQGSHGLTTKPDVLCE